MTSVKCPNKHYPKFVFKLSVLHQYLCIAQIFLSVILGLYYV